MKHDSKKKKKPRGLRRSIKPTRKEKVSNEKTKRPFSSSWPLSATSWRRNSPQWSPLTTLESLYEQKSKPESKKKPLGLRSIMLSRTEQDTREKRKGPFSSPWPLSATSWRRKSPQWSSLTTLTSLYQQKSTPECKKKPRGLRCSIRPDRTEQDTREKRKRPCALWPVSATSWRRRSLEWSALTTLKSLYEQDSMPKSKKKRRILDSDSGQGEPLCWPTSSSADDVIIEECDETVVQGEGVSREENALVRTISRERHTSMVAGLSEAAPALVDSPVQESVCDDQGRMDKPVLKSHLSLIAQGLGRYFSASLNAFAADWNDDPLLAKSQNLALKYGLTNLDMAIEGWVGWADLETKLGASVKTFRRTHDDLLSYIHQAIMKGGGWQNVGAKLSGGSGLENLRLEGSTITEVLGNKQDGCRFVQAQRLHVASNKFHGMMVDLVHSRFTDNEKEEVRYKMSGLRSKRALCQNAHRDFLCKDLNMYEQKHGDLSGKLFVAFCPLSEEGMYLQVWVEEEGNKNKKTEGRILFVPYGTLLLLRHDTIHGGGFKSSFLEMCPRLHFYVYHGDNLVPPHKEGNEYSLCGSDGERADEDISEIFINSPLLREGLGELLL
jgi:hypothetical protein